MEIAEIIELVKKTKTFVDNRAMADHVKVKGLADYVTQVDTNIQNFLARELSRIAPEIQFLGEEEGLHEMGSDTYWILDPIDGTTNLIHDYQHSTVSLGLYSKGEIVLGIIYDPFREDVYYAQKGGGSFLNGKQIHVSGAKTLSETIVAFERLLTRRNWQRKISAGWSVSMPRARISAGRDRRLWIWPMWPAGAPAVSLKSVCSPGISRPGCCW